MIRRLRLRNWRAYENLDLELGPGATFIVASNGVGKTSLVMAAGWGLFGDVSHVDAAKEIRGDADSATVAIDFRLPSGVDVSISRTVDRKGKVALEAELPDRRIDSPEELDALLVSELGGDPRVLAQLTIMIHGGAAFETLERGEFDLQDHLAAVFGVTPLFDGARAAKVVAAQATKALRKAKDVQRTERRGRDDLVAELEQVVEELGEVSAARSAQAAAIEETSETITCGDEWARYAAALTDRNERLEAVARDAGEIVDSDAAGIVDALVEREAELMGEIAAAEREAAGARGKAELIRTALADLGSAGATCPTCLRPLSEHDAKQAEDEHSKHLGMLDGEMAAAEARAEEARAKLAPLRDLLQRARGVPVPLEPETPVAEADVAAARERLEVQKAKLQEIDEKAGQLAARGQQLQQALESADEEEERIRELEELYRREAIALATHDALVATGNAITERYIEPLAKEVEGRWKSMFGAGGLSLSSEGRITRKLGGRTLEFGSLSGGEKVWALLLTRLLILGASTNAPFVWLDEPLEHLDPKLRKVVAGTLAKASSGAGIRQVIVTTYEADLARQLMEDVRSASLLYVTSG